ncbi:cytochrome b/b6 domain-containing protein [Shewanella sp. OMA3-2]|uniref:cytochrome b/b6 domain-containing protein n=1 Tax=Shewanella sp. OMA3-2 TaxID=2908650 RepID=UPI001F2BA6BD|nr:cytochrome b/b6 domain-containing protein [Shewanella sp. OMA3-2]UJF23069.1 cytochrome b/b6 domain-containing protein [Shewanella sp. OMA3-2]
MQSQFKQIKVWDFPVRAFHWVMVVLLGALWWSADAGEMSLHQIFAYLLLTLLAFRLVWGVIGSDTAKFTHFIRSPKTVVQYAKDKHKPQSLGHNPLGGYMVVLLLSLLTIQLVTGLFATDDIFTEGPLYSYVSSDAVSTLTWVHKQNFNIILGFAAMHVLAVIVYLVKGENLITAMITGYKRVKGELLHPKMTCIWLALIVFAVLFAAVWFSLLADVVKYM